MKIRVNRLAAIWMRSFKGHIPLIFMGKAVAAPEFRDYIPNK